MKLDISIEGNPHELCGLLRTAIYCIQKDAIDQTLISGPESGWQGRVEIKMEEHRSSVSLSSSSFPIEEMIPIEEYDRIILGESRLVD